MNGKAIKTALSGITQETMTNGTMGDLWDNLPDFIAGSDWVSEIVSMAETASDWVNENEDFTEDKVGDLSNDLANVEVEDYYATINKRVQSLSLWAYPELDNEVAELFAHTYDTYPSLTDLNSHYLYCAMRGLAYQILTYAYNKAEELEGVDA
jgi:hypothetical protein